MGYRWIAFGFAAVVLASGAWYFGRPSSSKTESQSSVVPATTAAPPVETPKELPAKVIEIVDLSRAYDPVREEAMVDSGINPATLIEDQYAPARIPYSADVENNSQVYQCVFGLLPRIEILKIQPRVVSENIFHDLIIRVRETETGSFLPGVAPAQRINISPREVCSIPGDSQLEKPKPGQFVVAPEGFSVLIEPWDPSNSAKKNDLPNHVPFERLEILPREVK